MKLIFTAILFCLYLLSTTAFATVGGPQNIELLGYDKKDQKLYLLRHYEDGRGRLPQLYYYHFKNKNSAQLVEVRSLYIHPATKQVDYDQNSTNFNLQLGKIQKRLIPLHIDNSGSAKIIRRKTTTKKIPSWYNNTQHITQYKTHYQVVAGSLRSLVQLAINYDNKLKLTQHFLIPEQKHHLVIVRYYGIPFETGYTVEEPVLLLPEFFPKK